MEISFDGTGGYVRVQYASLEQFEDLVERLMATGTKVSGESFEFGGLHAEEPVDDADDTEGAPATGH